MGLIRKKQTQSNLPGRRRSSDAPIQAPKYQPEVFKRNRTLVGTTSNLFDSAASNGDLESTRAVAHRLVGQRRKITSVLLMVMLAGSFIGLILLNLTASVSISLADSTGLSKPVDKSKYAAVIQDYLGANPISRLSFFLDSKALSDYVTSKLPEVQQVSRRGEDGIGQTSFLITMRSPVAGWQINGRQYFVDSNGAAYQTNYYQDPSVQIIDNSGVSLKNDDTGAIASHRFLSFVGRVVYLTRQSGFTVKKAILPPDTTRQLQVLLAGYSYPVKLSIDRPAGEQVEDMAVAIRYFVAHRVTPRYIDVRVSGKAFYK